MSTFLIAALTTSTLLSAFSATAASAFLSAVKFIDYNEVNYGLGKEFDMTFYTVIGIVLIFAN